jgi:hypothetical protein
MEEVSRNDPRFGNGRLGPHICGRDLMALAPMIQQPC